MRIQNTIFIRMGRKEISTKKNGKHIANQMFNDSDKLIIAAKESLLSKTRVDSHNRMLSTSRGHLNITVTSPNVTRALSFMNEIIKTLRLNGHDVVVKDEETYAVIDGISIKIGLREVTQRIPGVDKYAISEFKPTGILCFKMDNIVTKKEWLDKKVLIEILLPNIIAELEQESRDCKQRREESRIWREGLERERQISKELEERVEKEFNNFKDLLNKARRLDETRLLRDYIQQVEEKEQSKGSLTDEFVIWLNWAKKKADWFDPLIESEDEFLRNEHRNITW